MTTATVEDEARRLVDRLPDDSTCLTSCSREVKEFAAAQKLNEHLEKIHLHVRQSFPSGTKLTFRLAEFPDFEGQRLIADIVSPTSSETLLGCYDRLIDQWITDAPAAIRELIRITIAIA
jgi:hypothetical protein